MGGPDPPPMSIAAAERIESRPPPPPADVEIVIPVHNEEGVLAASVRRLHGYLTQRFPLSATITIADNASTDATWPIATALAAELPGVRAPHLGQKGRGRALRAAWAGSPASVVAYMDVDLSTDLDALLPLVAPLVSGHSDVAIGTRLAPGAEVVRGPKREFVSRAYNVILRAALRSRFSDAQCGFKAVRADVGRALLPLIEDDGWFFDTELLALAERNGLRIHEVPVDWVDDPDSRVDIMRTARDDLRGVGRLVVSFARGGGLLARPDGPEGRPAAPANAGQVLHFASVGALSTVTFAVLFSLLYRPLGAVGADIIAIALSAAGNLAANRRYTFASRSGADYYRRGVAASLLPLVATVSALAATAALGRPSLGVDLAVITAANLGATLARFRLLGGARRG
jgi:putative flippase GtrA